MAEKIFLAGSSSMYRERNSTKFMMCVDGKDCLGINDISGQILVLKALRESIQQILKEQKEVLSELPKDDNDIKQLAEELDRFSKLEE